jgi:hypothetical protein
VIPGLFYYELTGKLQGEGRPAGGGCFDPDTGVDGVSEIADKRKPESMPGTNIGVVVEETASLSFRDAGPVVCHGEAYLMFFPPGLPFDECIGLAVDGLYSVGREIPEDGFEVVLIRPDLYDLRVAEYDPYPAITRI